MIVIVFYALIIVGNWRIFEKAGLEGWKAIIPFYNAYCMSKIVFGSGWWFLLSFIPYANIVYYIVLRILLAQAFGKGAGFSVGTVLLPFVFLPILGLGESEYVGTRYTNK